MYTVSSRVPGKMVRRDRLTRARSIDSLARLSACTQQPRTRERERGGGAPRHGRGRDGEEETVGGCEVGRKKTLEGELCEAVADGAVVYDKHCTVHAPLYSDVTVPAAV